jgi:hypothetical protein
VSISCRAGTFMHQHDDEIKILHLYLGEKTTKNLILSDLVAAVQNHTLVE